MINGYVRVCIAVLICSAGWPVHAADWNHWRGPNLNGISDEKGWKAEWPEPGPAVLWKGSVGTGFSTFAVVSGRVYTMGNKADTDTVYCMDARTGAILWKHSYSTPLDAKYFEGGPCATPTVDGDRVYTISRRGDLFCLSATNGAVIWTKQIIEEVKAEVPTWGLSGSALIRGDRLYLNIGPTGAALDKTSGKVIWSSSGKPGGYATPVPLTVEKEPCLALFSRDSLVIVKAADGAAHCSYPWKTMYDVNAADPVIVGDRIFISSGYNRGGSLLKLGGGKLEKVWENKNLRTQFSNSVLREGHIYGVDENQLRCVVFDTGEVKWTDREFGKGSVMLADGKLIGLSETGTLLVAPAIPEGFKPVCRAKVLSGRCWTVPVLADGRVYCRNAAGDVVCVEMMAKR